MVTNRGGRGFALAIQALILLAEAPRGMATSRELAEVIDAHPVVLRRLLGGLRSHGFVEARTGPKGGWAVARDPARITLAGIYRALSAQAEVLSPAALDDTLVRAEEAYVAVLEEVTVSSLMGRSARPHL
ncbi:MAG TPA: Rrf2 family transcriptional regulator [Candidatus Binatia bacterium]|nr:Rrf2 family transcriptional regulator [Candidatus Binatia bacterium]